MNREFVGGKIPSCYNFAALPSAPSLPPPYPLQRGLGEAFSEIRVKIEILAHRTSKK